MKAICFAALITLTANASAAKSVFITMDLARNGEIVDSISAPVQNGNVFPFNSLQTITYAESVTRNKTKLGKLEIGTAGSITPVITSDGRIVVKYTVSHVHLVKMEEKAIGSTVLQSPHTEEPKSSGVYTAQSGQKVEIKTKFLDVNYVTTITATLQ